MPAEVIELLDTTDEEADAAEASSDDFKLRNLRTLCGPRPAASVLKNLLSNARGDVQQAANAFFASSDEDPREEASVVIVGAHDGGAKMSTEEELAGEPQADDDQSRPELVLKVGDTVVLSGSANNRSLREGPLRPGVPGTVQTVDRTEESDEEPYQVKAKNGVTWWYSTTDLEKVSSPAPSRAPVKAAGADSDPDVVVESAESRAAKRRAVASASGFAAVDDGGGGGGGDGDDDVVMTGVDDPTMEFAHARFNCRRPGFSFGNSREQNKKACSNCFWYVALHSARALLSAYRPFPLPHSPSLRSFLSPFGRFIAIYPATLTACAPSVLCAMSKHPSARTGPITAWRSTKVQAQRCGLLHGDSARPRHRRSSRGSSDKTRSRRVRTRWSACCQRHWSLRRTRRRWATAGQRLQSAFVRSLARSPGHV